MFDKFCDVASIMPEREEHISLHNDIFRILSHLDTSTAEEFVEGPLYVKIASELYDSFLFRTGDAAQTILKGVEFSLGNLQFMLADVLDEGAVPAEELDAFIMKCHHELTGMIVSHIHPPITQKISRKSLQPIV